MKKLKFFWLFVVFALANMPSYAAELKIGAVNIPVIMENSPQYRNADARIKKEFSSRKREIDNKNKKLSTGKEKYLKDQAILGADERKKKERELLSQEREIKRLREEFQDDLQIRSREEQRKLNNEIVKTINEYAKKEAYDLIIVDGVLYASDTVDITQKILNILKSKSK